MRIRRRPPTGHAPIHDDRVEGLRAKTGLHFFELHQRNYLRTCACQHVTLELQDCFLVFDQKNSSFDRHLSLRDGTRRLGESHFARGRQAHFDGGAAFWPIVGRDVAAVLLDDPVTDTQAQPGSFAHSLRRMERTTDAVGILDANSRVQELNPHLSITTVNPYADLPALSAFEN